MLIMLASYASRRGGKVLEVDEITPPPTHPPPNPQGFSLVASSTATQPGLC